MFKLFRSNAFASVALVAVALFVSGLLAACGGGDSAATDERVDGHSFGTAGSLWGSYSPYGVATWPRWEDAAWRQCEAIGSGLQVDKVVPYSNFSTVPPGGTGTFHCFYTNGARMNWRGVYRQANGYDQEMAADGCMYRHFASGATHQFCMDDPDHVSGGVHGWVLTVHVYGPTPGPAVGSIEIACPYAWQGGNACQITYHPSGATFLTAPDGGPGLLEGLGLKWPSGDIYPPNMTVEDLIPTGSQA